MQKQWFERWFGEEYKALYPHRDEDQAAGQARLVAEAAGAEPSWKILDIGCGAGRHLRGFRGLGLAALGLDLSPVLLRDAREAGFPVVRADMRRVPFPDGAFHLVTCFFTSFGYFPTFEEDIAALREFHRLVRPGGVLFLDLPNRAHVLRHLVPREEKAEGGRRVEVRRAVEGDRVVKRIRITTPSGESSHEERVRLFEPSRLDPELRALGLRILRIYGDEGGTAWREEESPRMSLLLERAE